MKTIFITIIASLLGFFIIAFPFILDKKQEMVRMECSQSNGKMMWDGCKTKYEYCLYQVKETFLEFTASDTISKEVTRCLEK